MLLAASTNSERPAPEPTHTRRASLRLCNIGTRCVGTLPLVHWPHGSLSDKTHSSQANQCRDGKKSNRSNHKEQSFLLLCFVHTQCARPVARHPLALRRQTGSSVELAKRSSRNGLDGENWFEFCTDRSDSVRTSFELDLLLVSPDFELQVRAETIFWQ